MLLHPSCNDQSPEGLGALDGWPAGARVLTSLLSPRVPPLWNRDRIESGDCIESCTWTVWCFAGCWRGTGGLRVPAISCVLTASPQRWEQSHPPGCSPHGLFWLVSSESLWGACVTSLPEARFTLSRVMLRPPPPSGDTGLCLGTSVIHSTGGILLASDRWGPGGLLYTHSALDGWDVSSALGMGEASSCLES